MCQSVAHGRCCEKQFASTTGIPPGARKNKLWRQPNVHHPGLRPVTGPIQSYSSRHELPADAAPLLPNQPWRGRPKPGRHPRQLRDRPVTRSGDSLVKGPVLPFPRRSRCKSQWFSCVCSKARVCGAASQERFCCSGWGWIGIQPSFFFRGDNHTEANERNEEGETV